MADRPADTRVSRAVPAPVRRDVVRGCDERDYAAEAAQSARYEELRALSEADLAELAGWRGPRQQMIATILSDG